MIYILIYWILNIFLRLCIYLKFDDFFLISKNNIAQNEYIYAVYLAFSNLLSGFLFIYVKCSIKNRTEIQNKDKMKLIYKNPLNKINKVFFLKLILISFIDILHYSCYFIFFLLVDATNKDV